MREVGEEALLNGPLGVRFPAIADIRFEQRRGLGAPMPRFVHIIECAENAISYPLQVTSAFSLGPVRDDFALPRVRISPTVQTIDDGDAFWTSQSEFAFVVLSRESMLRMSNGIST